MLGGIKRKIIRQLDSSDCGPACLAIIAMQYKIRVPIFRIRDIAGTDIHGTNLVGMVRSAEKLGFEAKAIKAKEKVLKAESIPYPAIAHYQTTLGDHYVVLHKVTRRKVLIADPAQGLNWRKWSDFRNDWTGYLVILTPKPEFFKQKSEEKVGLFRRFWKILVPYKAYLAEIFLASILLSFLGFFGAFYYRFLIDTVLPSQSFDALTGLSLALLFTSVFSIILGSFRSHITMHLANKVDVSLIMSVFTHILRLPLKFFESRKSGEILNRIGDTYTVRDTLYGTMIGTILDCVMLFVAVFGLFFYDISLIVTSLIPFSISIILVYIFIKPFKEMQKEKFKLDSEKESQFFETVAGIATVKAMGAEDAFLQSVEEKFLATVVKGMQMGVFSNIQGTIQSFVSSFGGLAVFWVGSFYILSGRLTLGEIISFNTFMGMFLGPLGRLISLQAGLQNAFLAADRLGEILDMDNESEEDRGTQALQDLVGDLEFQDVTFAYGTRGPVLRKVSFKIRPGQRVGIIGPTGSGKSTISKLIMKFYRIEEGKIFVDGRNINEIETGSLRKYIGYVPQDVLMFSGTMAENLKIGATDASEEALRLAAIQACAHDFIAVMPEKYQTKVSERGTSLSGGERQRVALARALIRQPKLLVLDEATSNLDAVTEKQIRESLESVSKGITTVIIAHRLATIRDCDQIIVLKEGEVQEIGNHEELLSSHGLYHQMWVSQMGSE